MSKPGVPLAWNTWWSGITQARTSFTQVRACADSDPQTAEVLSEVLSECFFLVYVLDSAMLKLFMSCITCQGFENFFKEHIHTKNICQFCYVVFALQQFIETWILVIWRCFNYFSVFYAAWQLLFTMNSLNFQILLYSTDKITACEFGTHWASKCNDYFYFWVNCAFKEGFAL